MMQNRELQVQQFLEEDRNPVRKTADMRSREQMKKSVEDTKTKIRAAFRGSEKVKASLR